LTGKKENVFTIIIIGLSPAYLYWSVAGMDTAFYSMMLLLSIYYFIILPNSTKLLLLKGVILAVLMFGDKRGELPNFLYKNAITLIFVVVFVATVSSLY